MPESITVDPITITDATTAEDLVRHQLEVGKRGAVAQRWFCGTATAKRLLTLMGAPPWMGPSLYPGQPFMTLRGMDVFLDPEVPDGEVKVVLQYETLQLEPEAGELG